MRPVAKPSTMKFIARSWFAPVSRGSDALAQQPLAPLSSHHQTLFNIQSIDSLHVHLIASSAEQRVQPTITAARLLSCQMEQRFPQSAFRSGLGSYL
jgi:hypothetical protein